MNYSALLHLYAIIGFALYSIFVIRPVINQIQSGELNMTFKQWWSKNWDDFVWMFLVGQILVFIQEIFANLISWLFFSSTDEKWNWFWDGYYDSEEAISVIMGAMAVWIMNRFFNYGKRKIDSAGE